MGKTTTAAMFAGYGIPTWNADQAVDRLYEQNGAAVGLIKNIYPEVIQNNSVDRGALKNLISKDDTVLGKIESIVHPLVSKDRADFIASQNMDIIVLDIPLLFETGSDKEMDLIVVVSAPTDVQRARVLARPGMTEDQFDMILGKQMPDTEKRKLADIVIPTQTLEGARVAVQSAIDKAKGRLEHA